MAAANGDYALDFGYGDVAVVVVVVVLVVDDGDVDDVHQYAYDAFDGDDKCFCDCSSYSMCETLYYTDYKRHYSMAVDAVVPCDVSMLIWCLAFYRIHHNGVPLLTAMETISVPFRNYFQLINQHHYYY